MAENVLFRADASTSMGTGHVMRCLALAQEWKLHGGKTVLLSEALPKALHERWEQQCGPVLALSKDDPETTAAAAREHGASWIVLDGYQFSGTYAEQLKKNGFSVLMVDDYGHAKTYRIDAVLNQNVGATETPYATRDPATQLLLGPRYALLRREFTENVGNREKDAILVTLGGSDPDNATALVIDALKGLGVRTHVLVGTANPHAEELATACRQTKTELLPPTSSVRDLMVEATLAVAAGGTTCYELACMGVPMVLITLAENQEPVAAGFANSGAAVLLGKREEVTPAMITAAVQELVEDLTKRDAMSAAGRAMVDGNGAARVYRAIHGEKLWLRHARIDDCQQVFDWANDPEARALSFSSDPIPWEDHVAWFERKLADAKHVFFIGCDRDDRPIGQVRFDCEGNLATISVSIDPDVRGKGYGTAIIVQGCERLLWMRPEIQKIEAFIKPGNAASQAVFDKAGFKNPQDVEVKGHAAMVVLKHRDPLP